MTLRKNEDLDHFNGEEFLHAYKNNVFCKPKFIKFKLTNKCNLHCKKCNYWRAWRIRRDSIHPVWTTEEVKDVVSQLAEIGTERIKFSGGEVTVRTDLTEILRYATEKGIQSSITSNGTLISKELAEKLVSAGLKKITISLDSPSANEHDEMTGVRGAWEKTTAAFSNINIAKQKWNSTIEITLACVVYKHNILKLDKMMELAARLKVDKINFLGLVDAHLDDKSMKAKANEIKKFNEIIRPRIENIAKINNIEILNDYFFGKETDNNKYDGKEYDFVAYNTIPCFIPWTHFDIDFRGYLFPCCFTKQEENKMGDVRKEKIKNIINIDKYKSFRFNCKPPILREQCRRCMIEIQRNQAIWNMISKKLQQETPAPKNKQVNEDIKPTRENATNGAPPIVNKA